MHDLLPRRTFLSINGQWIRASEDQRFDLVMQVSTGDESDITQIAEQLRAWSRK
jgi:death on curing protein